MTEMTFNQLGWRIFQLLAALTVLLAAAVAVFAFLTYPRVSDVQPLPGTGTAADPLKAYRELRAEWVSQMLSIGQMFVFGTVVPLVATTVGYLLGQQRGTPST